MVTRDRIEMRSLYVGLNLHRTQQMAVCRLLTCKHFQLIPRLEYHVTLAYIPAARLGTLEHVTRRLRVVSMDLPSPVVIQLSGVGCCREQDRTHRLISDADATLMSGHRVAWWAVSENALVKNLQQRVRHELKRAGVDVPPVNDGLHITLGSAGATGNMEDFSEWNVHDVPRIATVTSLPFPPEVAVERLHITTNIRQPDSVCLVRRWRK